MPVLRNADHPASRITDSVGTRYCVAVLGAWAAEGATYPFDLTKTRLQIQSEVAAAKIGYKLENHGMIKTAVGIAKQEGVTKLWSGLMPMFQRHAIYSGCRLIFYEQFRNAFKDDKGKVSLGVASAGGLAAGSLAQLIASPTDLVKVQMQTEGRRRLQGKPPRFHNCRQAYKVIYAESGILGFWRGAIPNVQRAALVNMGDLAAYDYTKQFLMREFGMADTPLVHAAAAFTAGFVAAVVGTPADVLKTRLMNQPVGPDGRGLIYRGMIDCLQQSVKNEGVFAMYKGFLPLWMRLGPWALINWIAFENIMLAIGGQSFCNLNTNTEIKDSVFTRYIVAVIAAWIAGTVTYPLDVTKTRLQIQNEVASAKHGFKMENRGMFGTAIDIAQKEGVLKLWSGVMAMWQRHAIYAGCRLVSYEQLRNMLKDEHGKVSLGVSAFSGMVAGSLAQLICSPAELVKVLMQAEGRRIRQGRKPQFTSNISVYKTIYKESGILGFWRGAIPNVQRSALVTVGNLTTYDYSKQFLKRNFDMPESAMLHGASAFMAGFVATALSTPADVLKTRLMNQPIGPDGKGQIYKGVVDCLQQSIKNEGIFALYKGFTPLWLRLGPWTLINWVAFENVMLAIGGKAF